MFTNKDIEYRTIFVVNCIHERSIRVSNGELLLEEQVENSDKMKTLTKLPFQKILALFIIGHIRITTPLIEKCRKFGVALVVMKPSLRPVFFWADSAEANFLLRKRQYEFQKEDISIARIIVDNKIRNQIKALSDTRRKDESTKHALSVLQGCIDTIYDVSDYNALMGVEGVAAKSFFMAFYQDFNWHQRRPRTKCDTLNATLDIGYTILFNYIECFLRMFGFDLYVGVYHRMWFKRKSLVCDIMEPFRPIIDKAVRIAWNRKQFSEKDFQIQKGEYRLRNENNATYFRVFFDALIPYKNDIFKYIQSYYRCFMGRKSVKTYPIFLL
ncbi:type V CRISPR-associated endonuclease Cas1 [Prevotella sp. PCHR]|uniref:CRISPR-associated endonuclease Cas1 n=2 Tax=Xylanibacter caecicola TaxID=2736294 RepID=A0ABX2B4F8_9BACT|nr:type V CRISPR-associated endonuclease Cas1 [Xylanibacter caecicola]NPE25125.1 type V CRISPR-associated endonuclease Cas1 [Xylanibacter caecicola]